MKFMSKFFLGVFTFFILTSSSQAQELSSRKGFFLNLGIGAAYEMNLYDEWGGVFALELGGGVNERLLLSGEAKGFATEIDGVDLTLSQLLFRAHYFPIENNPFYVVGGLGFAMARADTTIGGVDIAAESDLGFSMEVGAGYEFRLGRKFHISPEAFFNYSIIEEESVPILGATARFGWYF